MPNETTRLERAWNFNTEKLAHGEKGYTVVDALNDFATQECAALEKEIREFKDEVMQSDATIRRQKQRIESLTAQLAEAKSELQKYQELFGIVPTLEDVESGTTELL